MAVVRSDRWMALAGPLFLVLFVVALMLGSSPGETETAEGVVDYFTRNEDRLLAHVFVAGPSAAALLVIVSRLAAAFDDGAAAERALCLAGGVVYAVGIAVTAAMTLGVVTAADEGFDEVAHALNGLAAHTWIPMVVGIATMLLGAGLAVLRTGVLPSWLGWVAVVVGVVSILGPGGFVGFFIAPLWLAVAGAMLYLRPVRAGR